MTRRIRKRLVDPRLAIEARVLQALDHPRIVRVFGVVDDPSGARRDREHGHVRADDDRGG
ncbi:MAG TPA: hypothetical protein VFG79_05570 [Solirubrobacter sp.]|nr:hypothetical protein [Solirubrobacter sp.]